MTDSQQATPDKSSEKKEAKDSLGFAMGKSPWFLYALAQIPILIVLSIIAYFIYQTRNGQQ
jgi:uncharacterized membrane protein YwaF